ncbi:TlpA family protein disulfide reductase [Parasediminibacterium paludis]|uniref:TlpA family protein disulfide reductase n=1 Tax=Parasediminibacterium paludis TaxID=908966 RepID=A0ABV8PY10_9BACT
MKHLVTILFIAIPFLSICQSNNYDTLAPYLRTKKIPEFAILDCNSNKSDSVWINNKSLPKDKPIVFVYFSPECSHCEYETEEIKKHMDSLHNATFVFVSYHPMEKIKAFYDKYDLGKYTNIVMGRDPKYYIPSFFRVEFTPFVAVYTPQGNFVKAYKQGANITELISLVQ